MKVSDFKIENVPEADAYLRALLNTPQYRSMDEVSKRAQDYIENESLRNYFVDKARDMLKSDFAR